MAHILVRDKGFKTVTSGSQHSTGTETLPFKAGRTESFAYVEHATGERELYDMHQGTPNYNPDQLRRRHAASAECKGAI
jgi:hypothetical protein